MADWHSLSHGVLHYIFLRLHNDNDFINFRKVCRQWRAAAAGAGVPIARPWILSKSGPYVFRRPSLHHDQRIENVTVDTTIAGGDTLARGASRGWLAVLDGAVLLLRDPISRAEAPLPSFGPSYMPMNVFLSDDPLTATAGWMAFALALKLVDIAPSQVLAFCRPGDAEWTLFKHEFGCRLYESVEFYRGCAYVLCCHRVFVCDVDTPRLIRTPVKTFPSRRGVMVLTSCLVECGGDLLLVQVTLCTDTRPRWDCFNISYMTNPRRRRPLAVEMYKLEFSEEDGDMPVGLSRVDSIGDYALFVGPQRHAFALQARGYPGVRLNCVYLVGSDQPRLDISDDLVVFDLSTGRYTATPHCGEDGRGPGWRPVSWFCPRRPVLRYRSLGDSNAMQPNSFKKGVL